MQETISFSDNLIFFIILLVSITMHEFGHAFAADKLGDPLPRSMGRVTLNPMAHADLLGTIILPLVMIFSGTNMLFGWGKPVYVSLPNAKTRMRDDLISTFAGPAVNLILALIFTVLLALAIQFKSDSFAQVAYMGVFLNCVLFIFNMLPIPPLDGSHFLRYLFNISNENYLKIQKYGFFILLALIFFVPPFQKALHWIITMLANLFLLLCELILKVLN